MEKLEKGLVKISPKLIGWRVFLGVVGGTKKANFWMFPKGYFNLPFLIVKVSSM